MKRVSQLLHTALGSLESSSVDFCPFTCEGEFTMKTYYAICFRCGRMTTRNYRFYSCPRCGTRVKW